MIDEKVLIERLEKEMLQSTEAKAEAIIGMCGVSANVYCGEVDAYNKSIEIVKDLASEHNNGWISVEDELPPRNESVLCWAVSLARGGDCCCLGSCDNGFWFMQTQIDTYSFPQQYKVVAWHKLPAQYKKGE